MEEEVFDKIPATAKSSEQTGRCHRPHATFFLRRRPEIGGKFSFHLSLRNTTPEVLLFFPFFLTDHSVVVVPLSLSCYKLADTVSVSVVSCVFGNLSSVPPARRKIQ